MRPSSRGGTVQFGFDSLGQGDNAGEALRQRVVDLPGQPLAFGRDTGFMREPSRLGPTLLEIVDESR
ncbi:Uncharacterised protein [Mycobacteroides abscessus subsp. abscessus]|nr:Uncharacterised protein [Mycobacteroides abscessus subsp. abscessus]